MTYLVRTPFHPLSGEIADLPDQKQFQPDDLVTDVQTGRHGTVVVDHGNGIVRVRWTGEFRPADRETGESGRQPLVTDIGAVRLCA